VCGRIEAHVHYASNHDSLTKLAVTVFLLLEALAFIAGSVEASTTLMLTNRQISDYEAVNAKITQLIGGYAYLNYLLIVLELVIIGLALASVATLHSLKTKTHTRILSVTAVLFFVYVGLTYYYVYLTDQAMAKLPFLVSSSVLQNAMNVQQKFNAAYGFWESSLYYAIRTILIVIVAASFIGAILTTKTPTTWTPTELVQEEMPATSKAEAVPTQVDSPPVPPTKFCRYCGAKILRESKFCEECGKNLV
jgi:hypothetical protein